jgi:hypothetical protein
MKIYFSIGKRPMADTATIDVITEAQQRAVLALLNAPTVRHAAREADVPERTIYNWLKTPAFADAYRMARQQAMQAAIAKLQQHAGQAVATIVALMGSTKPDIIRLRAALGLLEFALRGTEIEDLRDELERLSALVREMHNEPSDL